MVGSTQGGLQIAEQGIDGLELGQPGTCLATAGDGGRVLGADDPDAPKAPQAIGDDLGGSRQRFGRPDRHRLGGKGLLGQASVERPAVIAGLHGGDEGDLVLGAAPDLAAAALPAQIGVVDLDPPVEDTGILAQAHDFHEFVLHQPGALVAHAQVALEFEGRDVVLRLGEQVHGEKPARERQLGRLEDGAAQRAALIPAGGALPVAAPAAKEGAVLGRAADRAAKALRPARGRQRRLALFLAAVSVHEFGHRKSRLKLHPVHRHGSSPVPMEMSPVSTPPGSLREPAEVCR